MWAVHRSASQQDQGNAFHNTSSILVITLVGTATIKYKNVYHCEAIVLSDIERRVYRLVVRCALLLFLQLAVPVFSSYFLSLSQPTIIPTFGSELVPLKSEVLVLAQGLGDEEVETPP